MSEIKKINIGGTEYDLPEGGGASAHVEGDALVINNSGGTGSGTGSGGGGGSAEWTLIKEQTGLTLNKLGSEVYIIFESVDTSYNEYYLEFILSGTTMVAYVKNLPSYFNILQLNTQVVQLSRFSAPNTFASILITRIDEGYRFSLQFLDSNLSLLNLEEDTLSQIFTVLAANLTFKLYAK